MSDTPWIGPASDLLKEHVSEEAGEYLLAAPGWLASLALLERAVREMEAVLRVEGDHRWISGGRTDEFLAVIAEHRGETPEATLGRLRPASAVRALVQAGYLTGHQVAQIRGYLDADEAPPPPGTARRPLDGFGAD